MSEQRPAPSRDVSSFQIRLPAHWYPVPLGDGDEAHTWATDLSSRLTADTAASAALRERMSALQARLQRAGDITATAAVYVPWPQLGEISCALAFELTALEVFESPEGMQQSLNDEAAEWQPGMVFRANRTWLRPVDAGQLVGSESLISHREPGAPDEHVEQRTVFGVFPPSAAQLVQFVFSTQNLNAFDDMAEATEQLVASLEVTLEGAA
ncbi:hypothetical protein OSC27_13050 [Microbacterium sp. STN6]|uniref:hypothetical protein n=1 Tax=Microbacterium sp. STN6 TaxID=2995588 RepID=UPI002260A2CF|nr:hypothetical protein [Microbacterium sp. STN6]MCX7523199.1 hypothetical protein [Microbacterium sp. STN6]